MPQSAFPVGLAQKNVPQKHSTSVLFVYNIVVLVYKVGQATCRPRETAGKTGATYAFKNACNSASVSLGALSCNVCPPGRALALTLEAILSPAKQRCALPINKGIC